MVRKNVLGEMMGKLASRCRPSTTDWRQPLTKKDKKHKTKHTNKQTFPMLGANYKLPVKEITPAAKQNRSTEGCSRLKRSVDMTSSEKNGLNTRTNASPKWDRTRCPEE